ncbi:MAG: hypothetical protein IJN82_05380, partial [Clostridia bacterium]|nr:hypothetical protein [Clostridia bacterium]
GGRLVFYNNGRFSHSTSPYSSYIAMGFYDTEETRIVLRYDDSDAAVEAIKQGEDLLINDQRWRKEE